MRTPLKVMLLVMLAAGISSCEKIKSIFDVDFDTTLSGDLDIDIQEPVTKSTNNYEFEAFADIDPLDDEDIAEYVDNIKSFAVDGVVAEVVYVNKENVVFKQGTFFVISDSNTEVKWTLSSDWTIMEGTEITLEDAGDIYKSVADILDKKGTFKVGVSGVSSETGVYITIRIGIDTKVTASPL